MKQWPINMFSQDARYRARRLQMVNRQLRRRGINDERLLAAMASVPRHMFVPPGSLAGAYKDKPLPIGLNQTISQPYIIAYMIQLLALNNEKRVLEIGTGCGYQTAILAELAGQVFTVEIRPELADGARQRLENLQYDNIHYRINDGYLGWAVKAPFDAIIVSAAPPQVPPALIEQLGVAGRLIIPVGVKQQHLRLLVRNADSIEEKEGVAVRFVPMLAPGN